MVVQSIRVQCIEVEMFDSLMYERSCIRFVCPWLSRSGSEDILS